MRRVRALSAAGFAALAVCACDPHAADSSGPGQAGEPATAPASAPSGDFAGNFELIGTEPFWSLAIHDERLILARREADEITGTSSGPQVDGDTALWDAGRLTAKLTRQPCVDGMSGEIFPFAAEVSVRNGPSFRGCAHPVP